MAVGVRTWGFLVLCLFAFVMVSTSARNIISFSGNEVIVPERSLQAVRTDDYGAPSANSRHSPKIRGVGAGLERLTANLLISRKGGHQFKYRVVLFDDKTKINVLQWPVKEVESLRLNKKEFNSVKLEAGSIVPLNVGKASQVDHSIVEAFAQGGRTCITSRVYPTEAIGGATRLFLFNNATWSGVPPL
ncbi:hypothetical protein IFM89_003976 [Coptis chinensis]|uniref:Glycosyl hydrolase family 32 C-terminal domain-containing protein n=1 Tax=Coptis chinensis TaxID=261450 RepID=A0A835LDD5_9MAGN|nr:hypothetical protein IFM89_003976 [Coptis chinensis]